MRDGICSSSRIAFSIFTSLAWADDSGTVYAYRVEAFMLRYRKITTVLDGNEIMRLQNGRYFVMKLPPGNHLLALAAAAGALQFPVPALTPDPQVQQFVPLVNLLSVDPVARPCKDSGELVIAWQPPSLPGNPFLRMAVSPALPQIPAQSRIFKELFACDVPAAERFYERISEFERPNMWDMHVGAIRQLCVIRHLRTVFGPLQSTTRQR